MVASVVRLRQGGMLIRSIHPKQSKEMTMRNFKSLTAFLLIATALSGPVRAQSDEELPGLLVQDLHAAFGAHQARAVHAKGIILTGSFAPSPEAANLTVAATFLEPAPVTVRFSDFTGIPDISDTDPLASPRGFAIKLDEGGPGEMDIVSHGFNGFPVATAAEFGQLLLAIAGSGPEVAKPTPLDAFLADHPIAATFLTTQKPAPESFATNAYFGVNSFAFTDAAGDERFVRYRFVPQAGEHYLDAAASAAMDPNFLQAEIAKRVSSGPILFDWYAQISGPGDKIEDPSIAWPEDRELVKLGTIMINALADQAAMDQSLIFLPTNLPDGIAPADPMIDTRGNAYPISFGERQ
jgi:catalase